MKITNISNEKIIQSKNIENSRNVSATFSESLDFASKDNQEKQLKQMISDIEHTGRRLASTRSLEDTKSYKDKIQQYISYVVKNVYVLRKESGPLNYGIHVRVEIINEKLDELTKSILDKERSNMEIANKIDEIKGLLIDAYK